MSSKTTDITDIIKERRSVRLYTKDIPDNETVMKIIDTAIWAPSGKNLQAWKIKISFDSVCANMLSELCKYSKFLKSAPCIILIFLDKSISYDYVKDILSCGMLMQNIMLSAQSFGLATCVIGELNEKGGEIKKTFNITDDNLEFMGLITLGYKRGMGRPGIRKKLNEFLL